MGAKGHLLTSEEEKLYYQKVTVAGIQGAVVGGMVGLAALAYGRRHYPYFQNMSNKLKTYFVAYATAGTAVIQGERVHFRMMKDFQEADSIAKGLRAPKSADEEFDWRDYVNEHRYGIIGLTWAVGMSASMVYLAKQRYLTMSQKIVQARMYAQAITLISLTATAGISMSKSDDISKKIKDGAKKPWEI
ncbi:Replication factor C, subunit RFC4 [Basidiobolus ranarum]|uniref:Replication factor C, subunit RFC4 n=1 Tax=Basidiobolus ranarum TaxID=34480 RepID=A0ABR2WR25_9FUNG